MPLPENMKTYLSSLSIPQEEKRYVMNFCKKKQYLEKLSDKVAKETHMDVTSGYGDMNSKIFFVFNNVDTFGVAKPFIQEKLDMFDVNFWQIYVTFINKVKKDYAFKYDVIASELSAIKPNLLYVFDKDKAAYDNIINALNSFQLPIPERHFFVDIMDINSDDKNIQHKLWHTLRYLINYKEFEENKK